MGTKRIWKITAILLGTGIAIGILGIVCKLEATEETNEIEPIPNVTHVLYIDGDGETIYRSMVEDVKTGESIDILAGARALLNSTEWRCDKVIFRGGRLSTRQTPWLIEEGETVKIIVYREIWEPVGDESCTARRGEMMRLRYRAENRTLEIMQ